mmetsp:Transcript_24123/g.57512  ORF Transcript_24123/g.57512 Transcript_24123/m.57512 type:complete len:206 (-) Transcript_24123:614-1231(-)
MSNIGAIAGYTPSSFFTSLSWSRRVSGSRLVGSSNEMPPMNDFFSGIARERMMLMAQDHLDGENISAGNTSGYFSVRSGTVMLYDASTNCLTTRRPAVVLASAMKSGGRSESAQRKGRGTWSGKEQMWRRCTDSLSCASRRRYRASWTKGLICFCSLKTLASAGLAAAFSDVIIAAAGISMRTSPSFISLSAAIPRPRPSACSLS